MQEDLSLEKHSRDYSRFVVLVFNQRERDPNNKLKEEIINGLSHKWRKNHNDPQGERMDIIYMDAQDVEHGDYIGSSGLKEEYSPLSKLDRKSLVYLVGHGYPGSDYIASDLDENQRVEEFHHANIAYLFYVAAKKAFPNQDEEKIDPSRCRLLRICATQCYSGISTNSEQSFAYKLVSEMHENYYLTCEVVGENGLTIPMATKPDFENSVTYSIKSLFYRFQQYVDDKFESLENQFVALEKNTINKIVHYPFESCSTFFQKFKEGRNSFCKSVGTSLGNSRLVPHLKIDNGFHKRVVQSNGRFPSNPFSTHSSETKKSIFFIANIETGQIEKRTPSEDWECYLAQEAYERDLDLVAEGLSHPAENHITYSH